MNDRKNQSFMKNVLILLFAQFAVKILGMVYRMVITNINGFGDSGNGYYSAGFNIYTLLLALSSVGIPNAISKMTAERIALSDRRGAHHIFTTALSLFSIIGLACTFIMFFSAEWIATYIIDMPGAKYVLMALSPSIFFVCVSSVIRGYFNGMKDMKATSTSQILEQIFKTVFTIGIVVSMSSFILFPNSELQSQLLAAGANFATSIATVLSFLYLLVFYTKRKKQILSAFEKETCDTIEHSFLSLSKSILLISMPISLGSIISAVNRIVDTATITRGIKIAFETMIPAHSNVPAIFNPSLQQLNAEAARLAGQLSKSDTLLNLPIALNIAFATVLVPTISGALAIGDKKEASNKISFSLLISILLILPCAFGYIFLAKPIYTLLYPAYPDGYSLLQLSSIALIFIALNQTLSGALQGCSKVYTPATGLFIGCIVKFILNVLLIRQPSINIYGAPISSIACQITSFIYSFTVLRKCQDIKFTFIKCIAKPLVCATFMAISALVVYNILYNVTHINMISLFAAIAVAVLVYAFMILTTKALSKEDILNLPAGTFILKTVQKIGFYK